MNSEFSSQSRPTPPSQDDLLTRALARAPHLVIPADFASRVARRAVAQPLPRGSVFEDWGPRLAVASGALLTLAMFALAPHAAPSFSSPRFDAELVLFAELATLALFAHRLMPRD